MWASVRENFTAKFPQTPPMKETGIYLHTYFLFMENLWCLLNLNLSRWYLKKALWCPSQCLIRFGGKKNNKQDKICLWRDEQCYSFWAQEGSLFIDAGWHGFRVLHWVLSLITYVTCHYCTRRREFVHREINIVIPYLHCLFHACVPPYSYGLGHGPFRPRNPELEWVFYF